MGVGDVVIFAIIKPENTLNTKSPKQIYYTQIKKTDSFRLMNRFSIPMNNNSI